MTTGAKGGPRFPRKCAERPTSSRRAPAGTTDQPTTADPTDPTEAKTCPDQHVSQTTEETVGNAGAEFSWDNTSTHTHRPSLAKRDDGVTSRLPLHVRVVRQ
jgi:hypothetical protein